MKERTRGFIGAVRVAVIAVLLVIPAVVFSAADPQPCSSNAHTRELDFWLGDWTISAPGGSQSATSNVSLALDRCLFVETWDGGRGHVGKNFFGYSPDDKTWYGMFADNQGRVHVFTAGTSSPGAVEFQGQSRGPKGEAVLNRVKVIRLAADKIEQTWEKSTDSGATWNVVFRGEYTRKKQD